MSTKDFFVNAYIASKWDLRMDSCEYALLIEEAQNEAQRIFGNESDHNSK